MILSLLRPTFFPFRFSFGAFAFFGCLSVIFRIDPPVTLLALQTLKAKASE
jgi:hypothetical protein